MHFTTALVAATSLLSFVPQTSAFLIPADISEHAASVKDEIWKTLHLDKAHDVEVECNDCPFFDSRSKTNGIEVTTARAHDDNKIPLRFEITENVLYVNGEAIYPMTKVNAHFPDIRVHQVHEDGSQGVDVSVDFAVRVMVPITSSNPEEKHEVVPVEFSILALAAQDVKTGSALVDLIRNTEDGSLQIARVKVHNLEDTPGADICQDSSNPSMCRVQAMVAEKFKTMMEEAKARASNVKQWAKTHAGKKGCGGKFGKHGKFGKFDKDGKPAHPHDHPHGPHHRHHRFAHMVRDYLNFIIIPVLLGIAGGIMACAMGMLVGQIIVFCWLKFYRGGQRGPVENVRVIELEIEEGEKEGLLVVEGEVPPTYEDVRVEEIKVVKE